MELHLECCVSCNSMYRLINNYSARNYTYSTIHTFRKWLPVCSIMNLITGTSKLHYLEENTNLKPQTHVANTILFVFTF